MSTGRIQKRKETQGGLVLQEIGKIKIGEKVAGKTKDGEDYERPTSLGHFRATGKFAEQFHKQYGDKPEKLLVVFISDDFNESCQEQYECWEKGRRWGSGDGVNFNVFDPKIGKDGDYVDVPASDPRVTSKKWDETVNLRFVLPQMRGILGSWSFKTKGAKTTIPAITKAFDFVKERIGTVISVPFELIVEKTKGYNPGAARNYSRVSLIPNISQAYMEEVRGFLAGGGNLAQIAPLMVDETKLLEHREQLALGAKVEMEGAEVVAEPAAQGTGVHTEEKAPALATDPQTEHKPKKITPNLSAGMFDGEKG